MREREMRDPGEREREQDPGERVRERERTRKRERERVREGTGERGREVQGRETEKGGCCPPHAHAQGASSPLAGRAAGRRRSAGGAVALGWPLATPQGKTGGAAAPPPTEKERGAVAPLSPRTGGPGGPPGRPLAAGTAPTAPRTGVAPATPRKEGGGCCPLHSSAQGA